MLNQFTADATGLPTYAGPVGGTAAGNVLLQALAAGQVGSPGGIRRIARHSFPQAEYEPREATYWQDRRADYENVPAKPH